MRRKPSNDPAGQLVWGLVSRSAVAEGEFLTVAGVVMILKLNQQTVRNWSTHRLRPRGEIPPLARHARHA